MASPPLSSSGRARSSRPYRRSSFNGAKQLSAAQASTRRTLLLIGALALGLVVALGVVVFHLFG